MGGGEEGRWAIYVCSGGCYAGSCTSSCQSIADVRAAGWLAWLEQGRAERSRARLLLLVGMWAAGRATTRPDSLDPIPVSCHAVPPTPPAAAPWPNSVSLLGCWPQTWRFPMECIRRDARSIAATGVCRIRGTVVSSTWPTRQRVLTLAGCCCNGTSTRRGLS
ncbi:hypothetical protein HDV57DRAFT_498216, partial [Trichoderma longibrachiatum]|uniref:Uncharacterized protein n=1 Tax=Trichoderma longibrachiatum ATCC 18648 TaxID=983965 RepID=A0A2T4BSX9_TRILO|nr:hypothetical protein M440DRAFT_1088011 [Trichoderma longibrachiatum ATCC 18648]